MSRLSIKGKEGDDAVLCTQNKTYALRSVTVSNSMVVVTGSKSIPASNEVYLSEEIHEIMELVPIVPKLDRINGMLRGSEYREEDAMEEDESRDDTQVRPSIRHYLMIKWLRILRGLLVIPEKIYSRWSKPVTQNLQMQSDRGIYWKWMVRTPSISRYRLRSSLQAI
jgi:hypothetical protein